MTKEGIMKKQINFSLIVNLLFLMNCLYLSFIHESIANDTPELKDVIQILQTLTESNAPTQEIETLRSQVIRKTNPDIIASDLALLVNGNTQFAVNFYKKLCQTNKELFFSPYSISIALAMTYAGAKNNTELQMKEALTYLLSQTQLHASFNALDLMLESRGQDAQGQDGQGFRLKIANSIWGQKGFAFEQPFLDTLAENYGAGLQLLDFINWPDKSRIIINDWVSIKTEEKIKDLLPEGSISSATRLVLTNAIYFNAAWATAFEKKLTNYENFYPEDQSPLIVPMMKSHASFRYTQQDGFQAIELPYDGYELSMVIIMPDQGKMESFEQSLQSDTLSTILSQMSSTSIDLTMPKFKFNSGSISLKTILSDMGMPIAFSSNADFTGIQRNGNLGISDVIHKAFVSVNEEGTEAAAATGVVIEFTSIPTPPLSVKINRPFIFFIQDIKTSAILFIGKITQPTI